MVLGDLHDRALGTCQALAGAAIAVWVYKWFISSTLEERAKKSAAKKSTVKQVEAPGALTHFE